MGRVVHLKLTGKAEAFFSKMLREGLTEQDIFAKALTLLEDAHRTKLVARIKESYRGRDVDAVDFFYGVNIQEDEQTYSQSLNKTYIENDPAARIVEIE